MDRFPTVLESVRDLNAEQIHWLLGRTQEFKKESKTLSPQNFSARGLCRELRAPIVACTFFAEHSTRTKLSFTRGLQLLGAEFLNFDSGTSSLKKGESLRETFYTIKAMGVNLLIFRCPVSFGLAPFKAQPPFSIINAGDGKNEHPTQALLDLFTMLEQEKDLKGKKIAIIGDIEHSRVSHSLIHLLPLFGAKVVLVGPRFFWPKNPPGPHVEFCESRDEAIKKCDLLYLLRIQTERHAEAELPFSLPEYVKEFGVSYQHLKKIGRLIPLYSPGPANIGVEIDEEAIQSELFVGHTQVENGVFMRMSIMEAMFLKG